LRRQRRTEAEGAARKAEEERIASERRREEEEQRQLRALVGDLSDDETKEETSKDNGNGKKRNAGQQEEDLFEFETEEEREERLARKRREERKEKLRKLGTAAEPTTTTHSKTTANGDETMMNVDRPRNAAGVIRSELEDGNANVSKNATNMEVDVLPPTASGAAAATDQNNDDATKNNNADSGEDSFDIFAADNATPVPTSKNAMTTTSNGNGGNKSSAAVTAHAQECDDAEGYYKSKIGEIITLPKERRDFDNHGYYRSRDDDDTDMARFRVLGIIGKGVFSSVIKCVEEGTAAATAGFPEGRIVAMKVIRNNEVMARAAAKEMRILRMLCRQQRPSSSSSGKKSSSSAGKPKKQEGGGENNGSGNANDANDAAEEEEDAEERERRERENHNIVRLLDVDPALASYLAANNNNSNNHRDDHLHYSAAAYAAAPPPEFRNHCIFLFEFLPYNLREVLSKFGKNVGINLTAVRSYARQLLCALGHLERHRVVHADLKPDNILVSANFSTVKLADFGSAFFETDHDNDPTPYLVSRFYRPPEVILGLEYDRMTDLWSTSVTLAELFTGSVLFPGKTNNDMLVRFMDAMGPFSHKMVRRHAASYARMGLQPHFEVGRTGGTYQLRKHDVDRVTGQPVCRLVNVLSARADARLAQVLLRSSKGTSSGERVDVLKFADFLNRCLALDPARRLSVRDALRHDFFVRKKKKEDT